MSEKSPSRTVKRGRKVEKRLRMCKVNSSIQDKLCGRSLTSGGNRENDVGEAECGGAVVPICGSRGASPFVSLLVRLVASAAVDPPQTLHLCYG